MPLSRKGYDGLISESGECVKIQTNPLRRKTPRANKGFHKKADIWLPFLTEESGILNSSVNNSQQGGYHLL